MGIRTKKAIAAITLALLLASALAARIAGLGWGGLSTFHHDERVHLQTAVAFYRGVLNTRDIWWGEKSSLIFYPWFSMYIVASAFWVYTLVGYAVSLLPFLISIQPGVDPPSLAALARGEALLLGRLTVVLFGTLNVLVVYKIGRLMGGRRVGLLAAAFLAFNGYHVANCHWLKNDVIAVFFLSLAFFYCVRIFFSRRLSDYVLAALFAALAVASKYNCAPVLLALFMGHWFRSMREGKTLGATLFAPYLWIAVLIFCSGVVAACPVLYLNGPGFVAEFMRYLTRLSSSHLIPEPLKQVSRPFLVSCAVQAWSLARYSVAMEAGMGIYVTLLGVAGVLWSLRRRSRGRNSVLFLLAVFTIVYVLFVVVLTAGGGVRNQETIPLYPFFALLSSVFLVQLFDRLPPPWSVAVPVVLGSFILLPSVRSVVRMDYGYWQKSTREWGDRWCAANIPPGSKVALQRKSVALDPALYRIFTRRYLCVKSVDYYRNEGVTYFVLKGGAHRVRENFPPDHPYHRFYLDLESQYKLIKKFDLGQIPYEWGPIKVYQIPGDSVLCPAGLNSGLLRHFQNDFSVSSPGLLFLNELGQCEGNTAFELPAGGRADRLLISPIELARLGVEVVNGPRPSTIRAKVGGEKVKVRLQPHEVKQLVFKKLRSGFPYIQRSYRVKVSSSDSSCLVRIQPDAYRIGLGYLKAGKWEEAIGCLEEARAAGEEDWAADYLLRRAYRRAGRDDKAGECLARIKDRFPELSAIVAALLNQEENDDRWSEIFYGYSGYEPRWLEERAAREGEGPSLRAWLKRYWEDWEG